MAGWGALLGVHLLAGAALVSVLALPVLLRDAGCDAGEKHCAVLHHVFRCAACVAPVSLASGYGLLFGVYGGFGGVTWPVRAMHWLGLGVVAALALAWLGPWRRGAGTAPPALARTRHLLLAALAFAVTAVLMGALAAAIG